MKNWENIVGLAHDIENHLAVDHEEAVGALAGQLSEAITRAVEDGDVDVIQRLAKALVQAE